ncbi:class I adenylate-forming enzyme family protein [Caenimonas aquaedulcis]|uniref:Acyl--CoA ligase n=1 Tax=Caenimonas aquaedulcis TaxID=2793270 RepID=A0A931MGD5_9BURK|nr:class I adenylate-forming enzyme family protein [Caenimonas aquaedulcis]MBG9388111.1 acyl--CoA ligase [Caenimonas aquaedulcis]
MNIVEAIGRNALFHPDSPAWIGPPGELTYGQLMGQVAWLASQLAAAGISQDDRVELQVFGARPMIVATLALAYLGAVSVALPKGNRGDGREELARACGVKFIVHNLPADRAQRLGTACPLISLQDLDAQRKAAPRVRMADVAPDALWRIGTSSGTTGQPKAMGFTAGALIVGAHLVRTVYPNFPTDRVLIAMGAGMPFAFHYWLRPLYAGAAVTVPETLVARDIFETLRRERITVMITTPSTAVDLANAASKPGSPYAEPTEHLRVLASGGGAITPATQAALRRHVCPGFTVNYGSSEGGLIAVADAALQETDPKCAGRLLPWMELQAVDDAGAPLPAGKTGRLRLRSPTMASGYIGAQAGEDAEGFRGGWFYSGDFGKVARDGRVYLSGRKSDVINLSGAKIDASRVEAVVAQDSLVTECAVLVVPGPRNKDILVVVVAAREPVDKEAIVQRCGDQLGAAWRPRAIVRVDKLPRNEAGKVMRERLRKNIRFGEGSTVQ